ncbi:hypothetical protein DL96DRAFT_1558670 [Flagelloscypha sp. PMI_526]|nr:hypothetical protein DL96DRAFT_1558670 [Flagelloscypha sp. PMI_526]
MPLGILHFPLCPLLSLCFAWCSTPTNSRVSDHGIAQMILLTHLPRCRLISSTTRLHPLNIAATTPPTKLALYEISTALHGSSPPECPPRSMKCIARNCVEKWNEVARNIDLAKENYTNITSSHAALLKYHTQ